MQTSIVLVIVGVPKAKVIKSTLLCPLPDDPKRDLRQQSQQLFIPDNTANPDREQADF
jgi:hypothetical protein